MAISTAGGPWSGNGSGLKTLSVSPTGAGNLLVFAFETDTSSPASTGCSGGGVTTWTRATGYQVTGTAQIVEIWWGLVTSTGSATITVANTATSWCRLWAREFSKDSGTWAVGPVHPAADLYTSASPDGTNNTAVWPVLSGTGLYVGAGSCRYGSTWTGGSGSFTWATVDGHLETCFDVDAADGDPGSQTINDANANWVTTAILVTTAAAVTVNAGQAAAAGAAAQPGVAAGVAAGPASGTGQAGGPLAGAGTGWLYAGAATGITGTWAGTANAVGAATGDYATWTDGGDGSSATLELSSFGAQAAVPAGAAVDQVRCKVRHGEDPAAEIASVTAQAYLGISPLGSPQALTVAAAVHEDEIILPAMTRDDLADLRVRLTATRVV